MNNINRIINYLSKGKLMPRSKEIFSFVRNVFIKLIILNKGQAANEITHSIGVSSDSSEKRIVQHVVYILTSISYFVKGGYWILFKMDFEEAYAAVIEKLQKYKVLDQAGSTEEFVICWISIRTQQPSCQRDKYVMIDKRNESFVSI